MSNESVLLSGVNVTRNKLVVKLEFCMQLFKELDSNNRVATTPEIFKNAIDSRMRRHSDEIVVPCGEAILLGPGLSIVAATESEANLDGH
jgi:hypothetical protein